jgi:predicted Holliday junction resolvase-like endonuclease
MADGLDKTFGELGHILGVCPCCGDLFYLSETRPYLAGKQPHSVVDQIRAAEQRLERAEEKLAEMEADLREQAAVAGLRTAKKLLKKIDPVFSGAGYDPHDVKVILHPVTYVVFNGMSQGKVRDIVLLAKNPEDKGSEKIQASIGKAVRGGNFEFRTLHVDNDGKVVHR